MIRCVLYARTSFQPKNKASFSIESQLDDLREYVARLPGAIIVAEVTDPDEKGPLLDRPGLNRVRAMAHVGEFDLLIAHDMDRIARRTLLQLTLEEELQGCEVQIAYVAAAYSNDDEGRLQKNVRAAVSEYERAKILERTLRGKRRKAHEGLAPGGGRIPYGYEYDGAGHLVVDAEQASAVRLIFDLYVAQGKTLAEVAAELNRRGIPTHQRRGKWQRASLHTILENETYIGTGYYNRLRTVVPYGKKRVLRPREEWIPYPAPAIVERAAWEKAQKRLAYNRERCRKRPRAPFLLSGMIRCAPCDRAYSGSDYNGWRCYKDCGEEHRLIGAARIDGVVWETIRDLLLDPDSILRGYEELRRRQETAGVAVAEAAERLERQRARVQRRIDALTDLYLDSDGGMSKAEYVRRRGALLSEMAALSPAEQPAPLPPPIAIEDARALAAEIARGIDLLDDAQRRKVLQRLGVQVEVYPDEPRIKLSGVFPSAIPVSLSEASTSTGQQVGIPFTLRIPLYVLSVP